MVDLVSLESKLRLWSAEIDEELFNVLSFWSENGLDSVHGGFIGEIDFNGNKNYQATKSVVLNTRILWTFSSAYRILGDYEYKVLAERQYHYIVEHFLDSEHGGLIWEISADGKPINIRKQAYAQGFGIYAFSEFYRATGNEESLSYAIELYRILEDKFYDFKCKGYIEALNDDWTAVNDMRLSDKDLNSPKSMNTHLHIIEPYTNLYRIWPDEDLKISINGLIDIFKIHIINKDNGHFNLFFDMDWKVQSSAISFGHDIEGAWLLHESSRVMQEEKLIEDVRKFALRLADVTLQYGTDKDGSIFNEFDNGLYDKEKHWWVQAEAMVGFLDAYQINQNPEYLQASIKIWSFIKNYVIDRENGEWYWRVSADNLPIEEDYKLGFWKCPYHNVRALLEMKERLKSLKKIG